MLYPARVFCERVGTLTLIFRTVAAIQFRSFWMYNVQPERGRTVRQRRPKCPHLQTDKFGRCETCGTMLAKWNRKDLQRVMLIKPEAVKRATEEKLIKAEPEQKKLTS